jgi:uncharacterized coiled-coil DUF342 family protein
LINDLRGQLDTKSDAITKAQKIIEKLSAKTDIDDAMITRTQQECERLKKEVQTKQARIRELGT